jgi:hypothetical protein
MTFEREKDGEENERNDWRVGVEDLRLREFTKKTRARERNRGKMSNSKSKQTEVASQCFNEHLPSP